MQSKATSVDEYIQELPEDRKEVIQKLREIILYLVNSSLKFRKVYIMSCYTLLYDVTVVKILIDLSKEEAEIIKLCLYQYSWRAQAELETLKAFSFKLGLRFETAIFQEFSSPYPCRFRYQRRSGVLRFRNNRPG